MLQIFKILAEFLHWQRVLAEIRARRLLLDELEKVDAEADELEDEINRARAGGQHSHADRLLARATSLVVYRTGLHSVEKGADLPS